MKRKIGKSLVVSLVLASAPVTVSAQIVEAVGNRAMGMAGAFVAVADDASATWWNPAALAVGPFVEANVGPRWFAVGTPPFGVSYYRLRITDIAPVGTTEPTSAGREDGRTGMAVTSLEAQQVGVTVVQTVLQGFHVGSTLKYLRGHAQDRFDLDVGVIAVVGPARIGGVARNLRQVEFAVGEAGTSVSGAGRARMSRQIRVGASVDVDKLGGMPLTVAVDADLATYATGSGERRVVALGAERWLLDRRLGIRGGARFNQTGQKERSAAGGASVAIRSGMYVEGHLVAGGSADERGWGIGARVTF